MSIKPEDNVVLVIDDDEMNLQIARMILERKLTCKVIGVDNGPDGINILRKQRVRVVLLDIMMPDFDGIETLQEIRSDEKFKDLPVMMLTASGEPDNVKKVRALGVTDYIRKPFMPAELVERVSKKLVDNVETVLLVDNDADTLDAMQKVLAEHFSHDVLTAANAQDAIKILRGSEITLIIAGANMNFLDGFKLLKFIAADKKFADVPFAVTTAEKLRETLDKLADNDPVEDIDDTDAAVEDKSRLANVVTTAIGYKLDVKI